MKERKGKNFTPTIENKKARFNYEILETYEAGLVLKGNEVKSMREGRASIAEAYARFREGALYLINFHIEPYKQGSWTNENPLRAKKLLFHKNEIKRLIGKMQERGFVLIPLKCYFKNGFAKALLGLGRGRKLYDKREAIKKRDLVHRMAEANRAFAHFKW